ncbi:MAG: DEAD/DEAH box helicase [Sporomusaceae bacterium]|nr:DEAD/DEAH box helicase [Sporomusaceae bacterium]
MNRFTEWDLPASLVEALTEKEITEPTEIQKKLIPLLLAGNNAIGQAPTGTGKTLAYLLPLLARLETSDQKDQALIVAPTYELASQIQQVALELLQKAGLAIKTALLIGSGNKARQIEKLKEKPQLLVGTSVRLLELIAARKIQGQNIRMIVCDEADRLLSKEQQDTTEKIIRSAFKDCQVVFCSATFAGKSLEAAKQLKEAVEIVQTTERPSLPQSIVHKYMIVAQRDKFSLLRRLLQEEQLQQALVFADNPVLLQEFTEKLQFHQVAVAGLYGAKDKVARKQAVADFRKGKLKVLAASDVAARGLDFPAVSHVFQLDFPDTPHVYLHRAGRTGRQGRVGVVISLVTPGEAEKLKETAKKLQIELTEQKVKQGRPKDSKKGAKHGKV